MSFKRQVLPSSFSTGEVLTQKLIGCGFKLAGKATHFANIEDSIVAASIEGMAGDFRLLSLLVDF